MECRINGILYTSLEQMRGEVEEELWLFLQEWYNESSYVIGHTSGSTGLPKEIRLSKADMRASAAITNRFFGIRRGSVLLLCLSVSYIAGKMMVVRALEAGAELVTAEVSSHPLRTVTGAVSQRIDLAAMVPMQVEESLKNNSEKKVLGQIGHLIVGGAPIAESLEERLKELPVSCYATYGMTETVSHVALRKLNCDREYEALGDVFFGLDERGCLIIEAPHLTERRFVTNDLVRLNGKHRFEWLGRVDHVINSGGIKFFPEQLERKLDRCLPGRFLITSRPDETLGESIALLLEGENFLPEELCCLVNRIRPCLERFEMPRWIGVCPLFRETASGKVVRCIPENTVFYAVNELSPKKSV